MPHGYAHALWARVIFQRCCRQDKETFCAHFSLVCLPTSYLLPVDEGTSWSPPWLFSRTALWGARCCIHHCCRFQFGWCQSSRQQWGPTTRDNRDNRTGKKSTTLTWGAQREQERGCCISHVNLSRTSTKRFSRENDSAIEAGGVEATTPDKKGRYAYDGQPGWDSLCGLCCVGVPMVVCFFFLSWCGHSHVRVGGHVT